MADERKVLAHSAEQIDEAVEKVLDGTVATKTDLQKKVNPNLLDNWYFGNPVNQRGGKIVPVGITYYSDTILSTAAGTTSSPYTVTDVPSTYGSISISGTTYYVAASDIVDGYILEPGTVVYTFDRWKLSYHGAYVYAKNGCLQFYATAGNNELLQTIDSKLSGETIILSAIVNDVLYCTNPATVPTSITGVNRILTTRVIPNVGYLRIYQLASGNIACTIDTTTVTNFTIKAMKLELGTHQTLAHQDENGNWVLNEIPDYGEQLARCQRYQFVPDIGDPSFKSYQFTYVTNASGSGSGNLVGSISFPVTMRTAPSVVIAGKQVRDNSVGAFRTISSISFAFTTKDALTYLFGVAAKDSTFIEGHQYSFMDQLIFDANL